jgi:hypothetical protein
VSGRVNEGREGMLHGALLRVKHVQWGHFSSLGELSQVSHGVIASRLHIWVRGQVGRAREVHDQGGDGMHRAQKGRRGDPGSMDQAHTARCEGKAGLAPDISRHRMLENRTEAISNSLS